MKTQIIELSQKDDTISVKEKMSWCQTGRILLVWPPQGRVIFHELELTLVKRYADSLGSKLAFVTRDPDVRYLASQLDVPVFDTVRHAQDKVWKFSEQTQLEHRPDYMRPDLEKLRESFRRKPPTWSAHPIIRYGCLVISLLAILTLAAVILPGARVVLAPKEMTQSMELDLYADQAATSINLSTGSLPTYKREIVIERSEVISTTGSLAIPAETSHTSLEFTNKSRQEITIPTGTVVTTMGESPVHFITEAAEAITVKPKKTVVINARAQKPGSAGNLPANYLVSIEGDLGFSLAVTNPEPATGGTDAHIKAPLEQDAQILRNILYEDEIADAAQKIQYNLATNDILVLPSVKIVEVVEESVEPNIGEPGNQLKLTQRVRAEAQVISGETLRNFVTVILDASLPADTSPVQNSLKITSRGNQSLEADSRTHLKINAIRRLRADIPSSQLAQSIRGTTIAEALDRLSANMQLENQAEIFINPGWWPRLPILSMRIAFEQAETQ